MIKLNKRSAPTVIILIAAFGFFLIDGIEQFAVEDYGFEWHHLLEWAVFLGVLHLCFREFARLDGIEQALEARDNQVEQLSGRLVEHIEATFRSWSLSPAEGEIAWLLIKGFSFNEIAAMREVREKSLRQQAASIYRKARLKGRAELVAYFLEDLLQEEAGKDTPGKDAPVAP